MATTPSTAPAQVPAIITYLLPTSRINRRFWAPGEEYNTGVYASYDVVIRNARLAGPFRADVHGFCLSQHHTAVTDWDANYGPDSDYAAEVVEKVLELTGADLVVPMGGMVRTSGLTNATMQPPAAEAHVDFTTRSAAMVAERMYRKVRPHGAGYDRFICFSLWRVLTPPPQDMPLALCEAGSVRDDEGTANTKVDVDVIPTGDALFAAIAGEEDMVAATIFHHSPDHRWWYFPDMMPDEVIFITFHDSDHSKGWRAPHTAFRDTSRPDAVERRSMEFRGVAFFTKDAAA
ncbi:CmcJ/NvfI family oxidoreductase [Novosphingobium sp.]|uniref:CmcJ/NvfI family oxidoreductase n=1 Tax=Novosphingobium sp. TaxID=1874826 RepID=UPI003341A4BD